MRHLDVTVVRVQENCAEQSDLLHSVAVLVNIHAIANIIRVLHEEEDDTGNNLLATGTDQPRQTYRISLNIQSLEHAKGIPSIRVPAPVMRVANCASYIKMSLGSQTHLR